jgi:hypothetical protein
MSGEIKQKSATILCRSLYVLFNVTSYKSNINKPEGPLQPILNFSKIPDCFLKLLKLRAKNLLFIFGTI